MRDPERISRQGRVTSEVLGSPAKDRGGQILHRAESARAGTPIEKASVTSKRSPSAQAIRVGVVSPGDEEKLRIMVCPLWRETIYRRFHAPYPRVPGWVLSRLAEAGRYDGESLVAIMGDEILGHTMYLRVDNGRETEVALIVEDAWQPKGIGKLLLTEIAEEARGEVSRPSPACCSARIATRSASSWRPLPGSATRPRGVVPAPRPAGQTRGGRWRA